MVSVRLRPRMAVDRRPAGVALCRQHHHGEDACIIDRPASRRWNRHMSAVRLTLHTGLRVPGPGGGFRDRGLAVPACGGPAPLAGLALPRAHCGCFHRWGGDRCGGGAADRLRVRPFPRLEQGTGRYRRRRAVQPELRPALACCGDAGSPGRGRRCDQDTPPGREHHSIPEPGQQCDPRAVLEEEDPFRPSRGSRQARRGQCLVRPGAAAPPAARRPAAAGDDRGRPASTVRVPCRRDRRGADRISAAAGERHLCRLGHPGLLSPAPGAGRIHPGSAAVPPRQPRLARGAAGTPQAHARQARGGLAALRPVGDHPAGRSARRPWRCGCSPRSSA